MFYILKPFLTTYKYTTNQTNLYTFQGCDRSPVSPDTSDSSQESRNKETMAQVRE